MKQLIEDSKRIIEEAESQGIKKFYALVSGGKDSVTTAHLFDSIKKLDGVIFIDTSIGIKDTKDFVVDLCDKNNWNLTILKPIEKENYENMVLKYGFPQPSGHRYSFIYLKWKPLWRWLRQQKDVGKIAFVSGTRRKESRRRFLTSQALTRDKSYKKMLFVAPLFNWSTKEVWDYLHKNNLEVSPVYKTLHLSGDCLCGAFAQRGEAELISLFYPEVAHKIKDIECKLKDKNISKRCRWGRHSSMEGARQQKQLESFLCADCQLKD